MYFYFIADNFEKNERHGSASFRLSEVKYRDVA
jgi:hypothetical protein